MTIYEIILNIIEAFYGTTCLQNDLKQFIDTLADNGPNSNFV